MEARQYLVGRAQFWNNRALQLTNENDVLEYDNTRLSAAATAAEERADEFSAGKERLHEEIKALNTNLLNELRDAQVQEHELVDQLRQSQKDFAQEVAGVQKQLDRSEEKAGDLENRLGDSVKDSLFWKEMYNNASNDATEWLKQLKETANSNTNLHAMIEAGAARERQLQPQIERLREADRNVNGIWLNYERKLAGLTDELAVAKAQQSAATERTREAELETFNATTLASEWHGMVLEIQQALGTNAPAHTLPSQVRTLCDQIANIAASVTEFADDLDEYGDVILSEDELALAMEL
ncbi:MAG: hypothetical protein Q9224_003996 [Gallowayella concinna]